MMYIMKLEAEQSLCSFCSEIKLSYCQVEHKIIEKSSILVAQCSSHESRGASLRE